MRISRLLGRLWVVRRRKWLVIRGIEPIDLPDELFSASFIRPDCHKHRTFGADKEVMEGFKVVLEGFIADVFEMILWQLKEIFFAKA